MKIFFPFLVLFLVACSLKSTRDFEAQGRAQLERLTQELREVHDLNELKLHQKSLKKRFTQLAKLMIQFNEFLEKNPQMKKSPDDQLVLSAFDLKQEMERLLSIEGAKEVVTNIQKEAFLQLSLVEAPPIKVFDTL